MCLGPVLSAVIKGKLISVCSAADNSIFAFSAASFNLCKASLSDFKSIPLSFLNSLIKSGPIKAFLYPDAAAQLYSDWAQRSKAAHGNAVQNLVIFAPLVILLAVFDLENEITALMAMIYFIARVFHYIMHVLAIPLLRTVAFLIGFVCQLVIGFSILSAL